MFLRSFGILMFCGPLIENDSIFVELQTKRKETQFNSLRRIEELNTHAGIEFGQQHVLRLGPMHCFIKT
jgi:hypothetical protein